MITWWANTQTIQLVGLYLLCWGILYVLARAFKFESKGLTVGPLYAIYKTKAFNKRLEQLAGRGRFVWRVAANLGLAVGLGQMLYIFYQLLRNAINLLLRTEQASPVQVFIPVPGVTISWENFPYVILALGILVITHEVAHAVASLIDGVPLKSAGLFFAVAIPGAMVELEDEAMEKSKYSTQLRVFAAGSASNMAVAMVALLLLANFHLTISPFYQVVPSGVRVGGLTPGFPAEVAGISPGDVIQAVNSIRVTNLEDLGNVMSNVKPGELVKVETSGRVFEVKTTSNPTNPARAVIGVTQLTDKVVYSPRFPFLPAELPPHLLSLEYWVYFVTVSVATINMLPLFPLDGDKYLQALLGALKLRNIQPIRTLVSGFSFMILATNLLLSYATFGFMKL